MACVGRFHAGNLRRKSADVKEKPGPRQGARYVPAIPPEKLRPFPQWQTGAEWPLMDTHPPNPDPQQPGAQPAAQVAAPTAGEQPAFDVQHAIATLDPKVLMELLENDANPVPPTRQPESAAQEPPAGEQPPVVPTEPDADPAPAAKPKDRLSVRALPDDKRSQIAALISKLSSGETDDLVSAALAVLGREAAAPAQTPDRQPATADAPDEPAAVPRQPEPAVTPEVAAITDRIQALCEQRRQAVAEYDRPEELRLTEEIEVARMDQFRAEQSAATRQSTARNYQREFATAVEAVEARYPELDDAASAFSRILDDKVAAAKARRDAALADPNYIVAFADEVAEMLGQRAAAAPIQRPPARPSRPVGSSLAPGHGGGQRLTREDVNRLVQSAPIADLRAAIFTE